MIRLTAAEHYALRKFPDREVTIRIPARDLKPTVGNDQAYMPAMVGVSVVFRTLGVCVRSVSEHEQGGWVAEVVAADDTENSRLAA